MSEKTKNTKQEQEQDPAAGTNQTEEPVESPEGAESASPKDSMENELGSLLAKLDQATAEVTEQKERYLRTVADLENYRKRALRDKEEARRQANFGLVEDLLPVLDNFKLGLKSAASHEGGSVFAEGFRMILTQMESALKQNGLEEISPEKGLFDPNFHEAVAHLPHDSIEDGHIVECQRVGYKLHDRLLRPAAVTISSGLAGKPEAEEDSPKAEA